MKRFFYLMLCAAAAMAFVSCEKQNNPQEGNKPDPDAPPVEATGGIYIYGSATATGFDLGTMEAFDEVGGLYSWEGYLIGGAPFQFPTQKDSEFPCYMVVEDEEGNISLGYAATADDLVVWTVDIDGTYEIIIDMRDKENVELLVELVAPDMSKMEITELYILGDATATGWDLGTMAAFETDGNGIFTWEGPLKAGLRFRFPLQKEAAVWWPCLMAGPDGRIIFGNRDADEVNTPVDEDGVYRIVVNVTDKENMTYTINLKEVGLPDPEITSLFMYGDATEGGWAVELAQPFTNDGGIFTWEGMLQANKEFRFNVSNEPGWFFPAIVLKRGTDEAVYCESGAKWVEDADGDGQNDFEQFKVDRTGIYEVVVDAREYDAITYTITYKGEGNENPEIEGFIKELYMLGPAFSGGYDLPGTNAAAAFTYGGGVFTWEGHLNADIFRFQTQKTDFVPCLMMGAEPGTLVYIDTYEAAGAAAHLSVAEAATYRIVVDGKDAAALTYTIEKL